MKQDKHKAKRSARYKKQHGIESSSKGPNKTGQGGAKEENRKGGREENTKHASASPVTSANSSGHAEVTAQAKKSFSRRKIESNWARYDDFDVNDEGKEDGSVARGADFQTLISQSGGAAAHLQLKGEQWDEDGAEEDEGSAFGDIFKVDFQEVADRLQAVPLNVRFGIPDKYFEKDVLDQIKADAAHHALRVKGLYEEEIAKTRHSSSESDKQASTESSTPGSSMLTSNNGKTDTKKYIIRSEKAAKDEQNEEISLKISDLKINDFSRVQQSNLPNQSSAIETKMNVHSGKDGTDGAGSNVSDVKTIGTTCIEEKMGTSVPSESSPSQLADVSSKAAPQKAQEEDLEDWLDDFLQSD